MRDKMKLKIGIYGLTSCYGCQLRMASIKDILEVSKNFDIVCWKMMSSKGEIEPCDIAFVEGSVTTEKDEEEVKMIREKSKVVVAMGSCAIHGGVQGSLFGEDYKKIFKEVYGENSIYYKARIGEPLKKYIKVDYNLPGCPPEENELVYYLATFGIGSYPEEKDYPVCAECRRNGYPCVLIEKNESCLGSLTVAGCNARCLAHNVACIGCRGPLPHNVAWFDSLALTFKDKKIDKEAIKKRMEIFGKQSGKIDEIVEKVFR
ncbi:MAG: sulfhydrogenase 1 subunit delta [Thermoplasmatales archaeon]|nr:sulfhydrogenase 1 subunit delta [Thermoplasmatales archaeon]